jgi:hypothetical protein
MQMRFVGNVEAFRRESFTQLVYDNVPGAHDGGRYVRISFSSMGAFEKRDSQCQDLKPWALRSHSWSWQLIHPSSSTPFASSPTS